MILAHKIRLKPNKEQTTYFAKASGVARLAYNWGLAEWKRLHESGEKTSVYGIKKAFNAIKRDAFPFVLEVTKSAAEQAFGDLGKAFTNFFRGQRQNKTIGFPKFKSKKRSRQSFYVSNDRFVVEGKRIRVPKLGWVRMKESLRFDGKIMNCRIGRTGNHWYASIQVERSVKPFQNGLEAVGIDMGIQKLLTLSDGVVAENQRYTLRYEKRLRVLNKKLSRQVKGSKNWWKTVYKLRQVHATIRHCRQDWLHKWTTRIVSSYGFIGIEDLNAKGMMANHRLAKHLADTSFGEIARQLHYKQPLYGSELVKISRWFPSSKTCSACGNIQEMPLSVRDYHCERCGLILDRDVNAAINIKREALRLAMKSPSGGLLDVTPVDNLAIAVG